MRGSSVASPSQTNAEVSVSQCPLKENKQNNKLALGDVVKSKPQPHKKRTMHGLDS